MLGQAGPDTVAAKRTYVLRAFAPMGRDVCDVLGLVPSSDDVGVMEESEAHTQCQRVASLCFDDLVQRVRWYTEAREAASDNFLVQRSIEEDLLFFAMSLFTVTEGNNVH